MTLRESGQFRRLLRTVSEEAGGGPPLRGGRAIENIGDATRTWWDNLSTAERKAAVERTGGGLTRFIPKKHDRSYIRILKSGRGNINIVDDAFNTAGRPGFDLQAIRQPRPLTPEEVAFGPQETAVSARTPGELQELDQFGRPRLAGDETAAAPPLRGGEPINPHIARGDPGPPPPPKEPPKGPPRPTPDEPEFRGLQEVAIKGEQPEETLLRRHQGAIDTARREAQIEVTDGNQLLRDAEMGQSFRGTVVPRAGQVDEFDEL
ncbi:hypothetical protein LCGC14_2376910, partial [marine sediment metagenome]